MEFSIIFWNIWLTNQIGGKEKQQQLFRKIDNIVQDYQPDCFGLNEVLRQTGENRPAIVDHLKKRGYQYDYYLPAGPWTDDCEIGDLLVSKHPIVDKQGIILGSHFDMNGRDKSGRQAQAIQARVRLNQHFDITVIVAHLMHLRAHTLSTHFEHQRNLSCHVRGLTDTTALVMGGDFNEFNLMPLSFSWKNRRIFNNKTGSSLQPTWYKNAQEGALLRANPDKVYWFKNSSLELTEFEIISEYVSDHKPLYAKFLLKNS